MFCVQMRHVHVKDLFHYYCLLLLCITLKKTALQLLFCILYRSIFNTMSSMYSICKLLVIFYIIYPCPLCKGPPRYAHSEYHLIAENGQN